MSSLTKKQIVTLIKRHKLMPVLYDLDRCRERKSTIGFLMTIANSSKRPVRRVIEILERHRDYGRYIYKNNLL